MTKFANGFDLMDIAGSNVITTSDDEFFGAGSTTATVGSTAHTALYLTQPGNAAAIALTDINQGQIGDCFLLSSIGEIARTNPSFISNMIHANADGTETVRLYTGGNGSLPGYGATSFRAVTENVTNVFPTNSVNNGANQDVVNGVKEIWPQVLEKAFAELNGGYGAIANGGNPTIAMQELTGHTAQAYAPSRLSAAMLQSFVAQGDLVTFDTSSANSTYNTVGGHAYMLAGLTTVGGAPAAVLANPWGFDQPAAIPLSQLSKAFVEVDVGRTA